MDVLRLDPVTALPEDLVEGYSSMIWSERHLGEGDFELKTAQVSETLTLLPEKTLISHLETDEVMLVETHTIEKDDNGIPELTVKGRTLGGILSGRSVQAPVYGEEWSPYQQYTTADISLMLLWNYLVNDTGENPLLEAGLLDPRGKIPNLVITDSTSLAEDPKQWFLTAGEVYPILNEFMDLGNLSVRGIRPMGASGLIVSFDTSVGASRGVAQKSLDSDISQIRLDVYHGSDRTRLQSVNPPVVFSYEFGDIDEPSYLFSIKDLKNLAVVSSSIGTFDVWPDTGLVPPATPPSGLDLRILHVDGGTKEETQLDADFQQSLVQKAQIELKKHNRKIVFDGAISPLSSYRYRDQYFLGDKVTLSAEYGFEETMIVSEYVRTEDQSGDRGYPTLVLAE